MKNQEASDYIELEAPDKFDYVHENSSFNREANSGMWEGDSVSTAQLFGSDAPSSSLAWSGISSFEGLYRGLMADTRKATALLVTGDST